MNNNYLDNELTTQSERLIHTPSSFARKNLNYAQETGRLKSLKEHRCIRENLDSYLFFMVLRGQGKVLTDGREYAAKEGDAVLIDCRKHYEHCSFDDNPWEIRWVHFNGTGLEGLFKLFNDANGKKPVMELNDKKGEFEKLLDSLNKVLEEKTIAAELEQSLILNTLMTDSIKLVLKDSEQPVYESDGHLNSDDFATLRESVNEHIEEDGLERILAIQYGLLPEDLSKLFLDKYGISLSDYIINRKFNKAKELLRFTIKPIEEIAFESGIKSESEFRRMFMEAEQMTPEDYRKRWAQWVKS